MRFFVLYFSCKQNEKGKRAMTKFELRKIIGERITQRRKELDLSQQYIAEKMGVNKSTIQRYEKGTIDNSKKLILESLSEILSVPTEWLTGETEDYHSEISDDLDLMIRDEMDRIFKSFPLDLKKEESDFSKEIILILLREYQQFNESFLYACGHYTSQNDNRQIAQMTQFDTEEDFNQMMFLREVMHTASTLREVADSIQDYAKEPEESRMAIHSLRRYLLN